MKFLLLIFLLPLKLFAQDVTGVWTGTLYNDTTKQFLKYELAISEYDGKLSGYSHTIFVIDSVENTGVKSVKIKKSGDKYFIEDDKLIYNNYTEPPAKGIKTYSELVLSQNDSSMTLSGPWKTNTRKEYVSITGNILLKKKKKIEQTLIIPKLENLGLVHSLSFMASENHQADVAILNKPVSNSNEYKNDENKNIKNNSRDNVKNVEAQKKEMSSDFGTAEVKKPDTKNVEPNTSSINKDGTARSVHQIQKLKLSDTISYNKNIEAVKPEKKQIPKAAADISSRKIETIQNVEITSDSLLLTLYDNGEIDGDTVSVLLNSKVIMPMQGLTANGIKKTIYLTPEMGDSIMLIMYAENLGSIPPNTGLLIVYDGDIRHEIRFTGDLQKNSAIILRRKKKS